MTRRLLDASTLFSIACGDSGALARLGGFAPGDLAVSALSYGELLSAAAAGDDPRFAENVGLIAQNFDILPFDRAVAERYGDLLRNIGPKRRRAFDRMVAAQALAFGLKLVTLTPQEFEDIPGLDVESWV